MTLCGCGEKPINEVVQGNREFPQVHGPVTAREALTLVYPAVLETSKKPVLLLITSGTDISEEGRSGRWEFVFHFPARVAQGVYSVGHLAQPDLEGIQGRVLAGEDGPCAAAVLPAFTSGFLPSQSLNASEVNPMLPGCILGDLPGSWFPGWSRGGAPVKLSRYAGLAAT